MIQLPAEMWRLIARGGLRGRDMCALSTTTSFFRSIFQEVLYEEVGFLISDEDQDEDYEQSDSFALELFARSVIERPQLAALVRRLSIKYNEFCDLTDGDLPCPDDPVLSNLALFSALRHLTVGGILIDNRLLAALRSHTRLTSVEFDRCSTSGLPLGFETRKWSGTSISTVAITYPQTWGLIGWGELCPATIRSLKLKDNYPPKSIKEILFEVLHVSSALVSLSMSTPIPPTFINILTSCPQLRRLDLRHADINLHTPDFDSLPPAVIPLLEEFTGPASFCRRIVRGRPVRSVELRFLQDTPVDFLLDLQLSTVPITKLIFYRQRRDPRNPSEFLMHSPTSIEFFGWDNIKSMAPYKAYCPALSRLRKLAVITGICGEHAEQRTEIADEYSKACPSLQELVFEDERWLARKDGDWEQYPLLTYYPPVGVPL